MRTFLISCVAVWLAAAGSGPAFEDPVLSVQLPDAWSMEGHVGEYTLHSDDEDVASLLLLLTEFDGTLAERLAEIERQFMETGLIEPEEATATETDGDEILYRRYRLNMGGPGAEEGHSILLHQYSWECAGVPVLLQVESAPGRPGHRDLFAMIHRTLRIRAAPELFRYESVD